jgi:hypothetical protein
MPGPWLQGLPPAMHLQQSQLLPQHLPPPPGVVPFQQQQQQPVAGPAPGVQAYVLPPLPQGAVAGSAQAPQPALAAATAGAHLPGGVTAATTGPLAAASAAAAATANLAALQQQQELHKKELEQLQQLHAKALADASDKVAGLRVQSERHASEASQLQVKGFGGPPG